MSRSLKKQKKREKEVQEKLERRRAALRSSRKERQAELQREYKERLLDAKVAQEKEEIENSQISAEEKMMAKRFLPGPNKPCLCGSGKKFKKCCERSINSGEIKIVPKYDPNLETTEKGDK